MATLRLNKVLRELNISLDRAVEHLSKKGFEIEARPTTKISDEVYNVLLDEFQTDKSKKVASKEVGEEKRKEKEALRIAHEQELEKKRLAEEAKKEIYKTESEKLQGVKTVGKIDVEPKVTPKIEEKKEVKKPENKEEKKEEQKVVKKTDKKEVKKVVKEKDPKTEVIPEIKEQETEKPVEREKITTKYQKLSGPKQIGEKIDLKQFEKPKKKTESKTETKKTVIKKTDDASANKKRRRRIKSTYRWYNGRPSFRSGTSTGAKGRGRKSIVKEEPSEADVQKQVRETLEKLQGKSKKGKGAKYRREKRDLHRQQTEKDLEQQDAESKTLKVTEFVTASEVGNDDGCFCYSNYFCLYVIRYDGYYESAFRC